MKKVKVLCAAMAALLLSGCVRAEYGIEIKSEKDMSISAGILLAPTLYEEMKEDLSTGLTDTVTDKYQFEISPYEETINEEVWKGIKATAQVAESDVAEYVSNDGQVLRFTMTKEEFKEIFGEDPTAEYAGIGNTAETEVDYGEEENVLLISPNPNADATDDNAEVDIESEDMDELNEMLEYAEYMSSKLRITMPNEPKTNIGTVEGNTVIIDLMSEEFAELIDPIVITCEAPLNARSNVVIIAGAVAVFAVFAGILVLLNKKFSN